MTAHPHGLGDRELFNPFGLFRILYLHFYRLGHVPHGHENTKRKQEYNGCNEPDENGFNVACDIVDDVVKFGLKVICHFS